MKHLVLSFPRRLTFWLLLLLLASAVPPIQAGVNFTINIKRFTYYDDFYDTYNYYYGCDMWADTNSLGSQLPPGTYVFRSPLQPTNGFNVAYVMTTNGNWNFTGGGGSLYNDDNFAEFMDNITNANKRWTLTVTNTSTTNVYYFGIAAALVSNSLPRVTILFPTNLTTQVPTSPNFLWQGPAAWPGAYLVTQYQDTNTGWFENIESSFASTGQTNWAPSIPFDNGTNYFYIQYYSNATSLVSASTPTNLAGQTFSGWAFDHFIATTADSRFTVGSPSGGGNTNLFGHYTFNNSSDLKQDSSGNGNHAVNVFFTGGGSQFPQYDAAGIAGGAVEFDGENGMWWESSMTNVLAGSYTISLWLKTTQSFGSDSDDGRNGAAIFAGDDFGGEFPVPMALTGDKLGYYTADPDDTTHSTTDINTGSFKHLVVTRDATTGQKTIYVDGSLSGSGTGGTTPAIDSEQVYLGYSYYSGQGIVGVVDDLQVYTSVLSPTDVSTLYATPGSTLTNGSSGITLAEAVDATNLVWITGGNANWTPQTSVTHDSIDAARSGLLNIGNFDYSYMETTVTGPCTVSFWWRNIDNDDSFYSQFYIDGNNQNEIYGTTLWSQDGPYNIGPGTHTLQWASYDDGTLDPNAAGFLDQVVVTPLQLPTITLDPFSQTNRPAYQVALLTDAASPTNSPTFQWYKVGSGLIAGATNKLHIPANSGTAGVAGGYFAVANNSAGSVTSATATVTFENVPAPPNWSTAFKSFLLGGNNSERRTNYGLCLLLDSTGTNLYSANSFSGTNLLNTDTVISGPGKFGTVLMKQTTNGTSLWARGITNNGNGNSFPQCIAPAPSNGVYLAGIFRGTNGLGTNTLVETANGTTYLTRFDSSGNVLWIRTLNGVSGTNNSYTYFHQLVADPAGNVTLSALISGTVTVGSTNLVTSPTNQTGMLAQFDADGNLRWAQIPSAWPTYLAYNSGVIYGSMGGNPTNFIGGVTNTSERQWTLFALNATNGQAIWLRNMASAQGQFTIGDIPAVTAAGTNVFITGTGVGSNAVFGAISLSWPENLRQYFARYDTNGTAHVATTYGSPTVYPWATVADASGNVYVGGDFDTYATFGSNIVAGYHKASSDAISPSHTFVAKFDLNGNALWARTALASNYFVNCRDLALANDGIWTYGFVMQHAHFGSFQVSGTTFIISSELQFLLGGAFGKITEAAAPVPPNPITLLSPTNSATQFQFSFNSQSGFTHSVLYRTNLAVGTWQTYSNVTGDGSLKIITIPAATFGGSKHAFVRLSTQ